VDVDPVATTATFAPTIGPQVTASKTGTAQSTPVFFNDPVDFDKGNRNPAPKPGGTHTLGLGSLTFSPALPGPTQLLLSTALTSLDTTVIGPIANELGIAFSSADMWAKELVCEPPILVG
jgi:hypothetical protein